MNIILVGLRGSGKSALAKKLAEKLNKPLIEIDEEVEKEAGCSISAMVQEHGEGYFRDIEASVTKKIAQSQDSIISTGGGTITFPENAKELEKNSYIIYLHVEPEICTERIQECQNRPALTDAPSLLEEMQELYKKRHPIYEAHSNITFQRSDNLEADTEKLIEILQDSDTI